MKNLNQQTNKLEAQKLAKNNAKQLMIPPKLGETKMRESDKKIVADKKPNQMIAHRMLTEK